MSASPAKLGVMRAIPRFAYEVRASARTIWEYAAEHLNAWESPDARTFFTPGFTAISRDSEGRIVELADRELDTFIERRARQAEDDRRTEEAWTESVRLYDAKRQEENRAAWHGWHLDTASRPPSIPHTVQETPSKLAG